MTREEALCYFKRRKKIFGLSDEVQEAEDMAIKALEQEPIRWIPVNERLPEINQRVLVTSYGRVCYAMMISEDGNNGYPVFRLQDSLKERVVCETTVHNEFTTSRITAWMPLPEPYKLSEIPTGSESEGRNGN